MSSTAARALVQLLDSQHAVIHLLNPKPVSWSSLASAFASHLGVKLVPFSEWVGKLKQLDGQKTPEELHALRLLSFYQGLLKNFDRKAGEAFGFPQLEINNAVSDSEILRKGSGLELNEENVQRWLQYWKKKEGWKLA
jgi:hypothetical protein